MFYNLILNMDLPLAVERFLIRIVMEESISRAANQPIFGIAPVYPLYVLEDDNSQDEQAYYCTKRRIGK